MDDRRHKASTDADTLTVRVRVQSRGSRCEIQGFIDGSLRVKTTAAPSDGKANADVIRQLALAYKVPKSQVKLLRGANHREKVFSIEAPKAEPEFLSPP